MIRNLRGSHVSGAETFGLTFATLRSQRDDVQSRLQQILAWLGSGFDGVIALDEAHELANAAGTETKFGSQKGSEQGLAGVRLQNRLAQTGKGF